MDDSTTEPISAGSRTLGIAQTIRQQRGQVREFVGEQRARLDRVEAQLAEQLERIRQELSAEREQTDQAHSRISQRTAELADQQALLDQLRRELVAREQELSELRQRVLHEHEAQSARVAEESAALAREQASLAECLASAREQATSVALREEQLGTQLEALAARESALRDRETELASAERRLTENQAVLARRTTDLDRRAKQQSEQQERREAEFEKQKSAQAVELVASQRCLELEAQSETLRSQLSEYEARVAELIIARDLVEQQRDSAAAAGSAEVMAVQAEFDEKLAQRAVAFSELQADRDRLAAELAMKGDEREELRTELASHAEQCLESQRQLVALHAELQGVRQELTDATRQLQLQDSILSESRAEFSEAETRLRELQIEMEQQGQAAAQASSAEIERLEKERQLLLVRLVEAEAQAQAKSRAVDETRAADYERRYQLALDDLREQKEKIVELERKLSQVEASSAHPSGSLVGMDWETQKRRLLASLESLSGDDNPAEAEDRIRLKEAIEVTERVVAEKDCELQRLRTLLEAGAAEVAAEDAQAVAAALDHDPSIQQERLKLQNLEQEWQEKLRQAEVDLSVERAKIARERAWIEDKLEQLRTEQAQCQQQGGATESPPRAPTRGRWLARLGLKEGSGD